MGIRQPAGQSKNQIKPLCIAASPFGIVRQDPVETTADICAAFGNPAGGLQVTGPAGGEAFNLTGTEGRHTKGNFQGISSYRDLNLHSGQITERNDVAGNGFSVHSQALFAGTLDVDGVFRAPEAIWKWQWAAA